MGKKYIIDLNPDCVEGEYLRIPARIAGEEQWLVTKAALTPYNAPDLEQVRLEAEQLGMIRAWGAARKIIHMPEGDLLNVFTECYSAVCTALQVILKYDASECIEKIQAYEQEEFKVGDEFENESGKKFVVLKMNGTEIDRYIDEEGKTYCMIAKYKVIRKTGRHFPEIAEALEKMRKGQE